MTMINCKERDNCSKMLYMSKSLCLIPGESVLKSSMLINSYLTLTEYRLYLIYENAEAAKSIDKLCHVSIPLSLILKIEQQEFKHLRLLTKIGGTFILSFDSTENCSSWLQTVTEILMPANCQKLFAFQFFKSIQEQSSTLIRNEKKSLRNLLQNEFQRMKFNKSWKISDVNSDFKICNSYPRFHIVPSSINNEDIRAMAEFRGNKRFPSVTWRSQRNGTVLIRCAQPQVGLMCWRNSSDETFFKEVMKCLKVTECALELKRLLIIDARHYSTAQFNRIRGGGVEFSEYYGDAEIMFMQLENIHSVRSSFDYISLIAFNSDNWLTNYESSYWLKHISKLLKSASDIAKALNEDGRSVIIHCSDGWDRTPQLTSLTQILLDGYYRSIEGFQVLIEKEWLQFGHKFADRCGNNKPIDQKERSPVFVQWLDCVHQLICQFPRYFEFNDTFLIKLAIHVHSGLFGNFLFNTEEERLKNNVSDSTLSIWSFLSESNDIITNPLYYKSFDVDQDQLYETVIYPTYNNKFIQPWNRLFLEALNPLDGHRIFSIDYSSTKPLVMHQSHICEEFQEEEEIADVPSLNQLFPLRKFKSETDISSKCKKVLNCTDELKSDPVTMNMSVCKGRFINQALSTSTLNEPMIIGVINGNCAVHYNSDYEPKSMKDNNFQPIELVAYSNGTIGDESNHNTTRKDDDISPRDSSTGSMKTSEVEILHFRLVNMEDKKETYISGCNAACDFDGLYLCSEPVNELTKQWKSKFFAQEALILQLKEKLNFGSLNQIKIRTDSASTNERERNEDSVSSHDSFILLESSPLSNNHHDKTVSDIFSHCKKSPKSTLAARIFDSSDHCRYSNSSYNQAYTRKSMCNQATYQQCDTTSNGSEKAQA